MTTTLLSTRAAAATRSARPSSAALARTELAKSLTTRSGRWVAAGAVLVAPAGVLLGSLTSEGTMPGAIVIGIGGMITGLVLLALGVLSTAGEWTHRSVQTTFLLVPQRTRVLAAKGAAMTVLGLALAAASAAAVSAVLWAVPDSVDATATGRAAAVAVVSGAAFAVTGAGLGAAAGNVAAALTGTYLTVLGVFPVLQLVRPELVEKLDPTAAVVSLAQHGVTATPVLVVAGWVVGSGVLGTLVTRRRDVA